MKHIYDFQENDVGFKSKMSALSSALSRPLQDNQQNQVAVTLTLNGQAAENIGGVISAIADLLKIAVPPPYEVSRSPSPEAVYRQDTIKRKLKWELSYGEKIMPCGSSGITHQHIMTNHQDYLT